MPVAYEVEERREGREIRFTGRGDTIAVTWQNEYQVVVTVSGGSSLDDVGPYDVATAPGLPIVNRSIYLSAGKIIPFVVCRDKSAKQDPKNKSRWVVRVSYRSLTGNQTEAANQPIDPPVQLTDITPDELPDLGEIEQVLFEDKSDPAKAIKLPSGAFFSEPVMERIPTLTIKMSQYEASITYEQMLERKFRLNEGDYRGQSAGNWLIEHVETTPVTVQLAGGPVNAALVTYTLMLSPLAEGWARRLALVDYKHLVNGKFVPNLEGDPLTATLTYVNSSGVRKTDQSAPDYEDFVRYDETDFDAFLQA